MLITPGSGWFHHWWEGWVVASRWWQPCLINQGLIAPEKYPAWNFSYFSYIWKTAGPRWNIKIRGTFINQYRGRKHRKMAIRAKWKRQEMKIKTVAVSRRPDSFFGRRLLLRWGGGGSGISPLALLRCWLSVCYRAGSRNVTTKWGFWIWIQDAESYVSSYLIC